MTLLLVSYPKSFFSIMEDKEEEILQSINIEHTYSYYFFKI